MRISPSGVAVIEFEDPISGAVTYHATGKVRIGRFGESANELGVVVEAAGLAEAQSKAEQLLEELARETALAVVERDESGELLYHEYNNGQTRVFNSNGVEVQTHLMNGDSLFYDDAGDVQRTEIWSLFGISEAHSAAGSTYYKYDRTGLLTHAIDSQGRIVTLANGSIVPSFDNSDAREKIRVRHTSMVEGHWDTPDEWEGSEVNSRDSLNKYLNDLRQRGLSIEGVRWDGPTMTAVERTYVDGVLREREFRLDVVGDGDEFPELPNEVGVLAKGRGTFSQKVDLTRTLDSYVSLYASHQDKLSGAIAVVSRDAVENRRNADFYKSRAENLTEPQEWQEALELASIYEREADRHAEMLRDLKAGGPEKELALEVIEEKIGIMRLERNENQQQLTAIREHYQRELTANPPAWLAEVGATTVTAPSGVPRLDVSTAELDLLIKIVDYRGRNGVQDDDLALGSKAQSEQERENLWAELLRVRAQREKRQLVRSVAEHGRSW